MREILFRGQCQNGVWVTGNLAIIPKGWAGVAAGSYISDYSGMPFAYCVRPETVGQFTGLTDKTGRPIFEGDIVKKEYGVGYETNYYPSYPKNTQNCTIEIVEFCYGDNEDSVYWKPLKPPSDEHFYYMYEVIGNIYDNPELAGGKKK